MRYYMIIKELNKKNKSKIHCSKCVSSKAEVVLKVNRIKVYACEQCLVKFINEVVSEEKWNEIH